MTFKNGDLVVSASAYRGVGVVRWFREKGASIDGAPPLETDVAGVEWPAAPGYPTAERRVEKADAVRFASEADLATWDYVQRLVRGELIVPELPSLVDARALASMPQPPRMTLDLDAGRLDAPKQITQMLGKLFQKMGDPAPAAALFQQIAFGMLCGPNSDVEGFADADAAKSRVEKILEVALHAAKKMSSHLQTLALEESMGPAKGA